MQKGEFLLEEEMFELYKSDVVKRDSTSQEEHYEMQLKKRPENLHNNYYDEGLFLPKLCLIVE